MTDQTVAVPDPDLADYDVILVNISGGKDSMACLDETVRHADAAGVRHRIVTVFCDLGDEDEWPGTRDLAAEHADHYGLRHEVVRREVEVELDALIRPVYVMEHPSRVRSGGRIYAPQSLAEHIEARGMWPDAARRYCTSDMKRAPVYRLMTKLAAERRAAGTVGQVRILNVMGLRAQESPARRKMASFSHDDRASNQSVRWIDQWLPIHGWTIDQVWQRIAEAGTRPHPVYAAGMPRLSCRFCVLASESALVLAAQLDPEGAQRRAAMEARMGHSFRQNLPMSTIIAKAAAAPRRPAADWMA